MFCFRVIAFLLTDGVFQTWSVFSFISIFTTLVTFMKYDEVTFITLLCSERRIIAANMCSTTIRYTLSFYVFLDELLIKDLYDFRF